jgi:hypothetical protein
MSDFKLVQLLNPIQINTNIHPTGVYSAATTYGVGDSVSYNNSSYVAILPTTGNAPTNTTYWQLLATVSTNRLTTTARNNTGATIPKGSVVYFSGASGNLPTLALSQANTELNSTKTVGITAAAIANNTNGEVVIFGTAESLNTSAFAAGVALWLSPTVPGGMTTTKPHAPDHMVFIGFVVRSHPTDGVIEVKVQNGFELEELHDVAINSLVNEQIIRYEASTDLWKNHTLTKSDIGLGSVPNVDATNPANITQDATHRFVTDTEKTTWNNKENAITAGTTSQYFRGDKTFQTLDSTAVGLGNVPNVDATNAGNIYQDSSHRFVSDSQISDWDAKLSTNGMAYVTNKDFDWSTVRFISPTNNSFLKFDLTGSTGAYQNVFNFSNTFNNSYNFPNTTGTIALTSDITSAVSNKVDKAGDTLTGTLNSAGAASSGYYNSLVTSNVDPLGTSQITFLSDTSVVYATGVTGSTFATFSGIGPNSGFSYSDQGFVSVTNLASGYKWIQGGTQVASIVNGSFTANQIDASPVNFNGLSQSTPTTSDFLPYTNGTNNYKASLNDMPVSAPQNLNSIVNALIFG